MESSGGTMARGNIFVAIVIGLGSMATIAAALSGGTWILDHAIVFPAIVGAVILSERFVINLSFVREAVAFSVVEVALALALLLVPMQAFVLAAAVGILGGQVIRGRPPVKIAFNTAMYALAASGAAGVFALLTSAGFGDSNRWLAAIVAMGVFYALNQIMLATVVALFDNQKVLDIVRHGLLLAAVVSAGSTSLGILTHHLATSKPEALWLLPIPFLLSYTAYKGWIHSKEESRKMHKLYEVGSKLTNSLGTEHGLGRFLSAATELFRAEGAQIITFEGPGALAIISHTGNRDLHVLPPASASAEGHGAIETYLQSQEWDSHLYASLSSEIGVAGALVVYGHNDAEGPAAFPTKDAALLQTLANEASIAIRNVALFESISEERAKLSDIVEHTSDGIYQVSPDRRIMTWNPAMEKITGFSAAEAVGQMCFNVLRARDRQNVDMCSRSCPILGAAEHRCLQETDAQIMTKDGAARWIHYTHNPILDGQGKMTSDVIVVRDITKQKAAQEMKDDFVATVSHELRTPITPIKGFLLTLLRPGLEFKDEDRQRYYQMMLRQTERLEGLVEDLLDASRLESGRLNVETTTLNAAELVEQIIAGYRVSHPSRELVIENTEPAFAQSNSARLEQVLTNLLQNALRYSPEKSPVAICTTQSEREVTISVTDQGPGIPIDEQELIFERFYRMGHHLTREQGGTGLGLFIAKRLAEAMGGRISLESRLGHGSKFVIHLPAAQGSLDSSEVRTY
ncbi:MAG: PAS domain S-box protein [Actinobacteria bacterium]|nr:PAS domain S-box protein [Actinomycetota bacterium]